MTVAGNMNAMAALLAANGFNAAAFRDSMSVDAPSVSPSAPTIENEQTVQVGQMKAETPETAAAIDNIAAQGNELGGMESIRQGLEAKAQQMEAQALAASDPKDAAAMQAEVEDRAAAALVSKNSKTPELDKNINKMLGLKGNVAGIEMLADMPKLEGAEVSASEIGNLQAQNVGSQQRSQSQGRGA